MKITRYIEPLTAGLMIITAIFFSFLPTLYYLSKATESTVFPFVHNNHPDYYFYLSLMRQGYEGKWLVTTRFTPEHFQPQFIQTFFVLLGMIGKLTSFSLPFIYTAARLFFGCCIGLASYFLLRGSEKKVSVRLIGIFFILFATSFWIFQNKQITQFMTFWTAFDASERATFLPHHLFGTMSIILSIFFLSLFLQTREKFFLTAAVIVGFLGTYINPISLANFFLAIVIFFPIYSALNFRKKKDFYLTLMTLFIYLGFCGIPFLYSILLQHSTFPWTTYSPQRSALNFPLTFKEYILGLGPALMLGVFGAARMLKKNNFFTLIIISWFLAPFLGIFVIARFLQLGNVYFFYAAHYVPVGILGGYGLETICEWVANKIKINKNSLILLVMVVLLGYFSVSWYSSIKKEISRWTPNIYNIYLPKDFLTAFAFLEAKTQPESVVLSGGFLGNIIPAFSHNRVFYGHPVNTFDFEKKANEAGHFFQQTDTAFASLLIKQYRIDYVFYTYDTGPVKQNFVANLGLKQIYSNPIVTIFKTAK